MSELAVFWFGWVTGLAMGFVIWKSKGYSKPELKGRSFEQYAKDEFLSALPPEQRAKF